MAHIQVNGSVKKKLTLFIGGQSSQKKKKRGGKKSREKKTRDRKRSEEKRGENKRNGRNNRRTKLLTIFPLLLTVNKFSCT